MKQSIIFVDPVDARHIAGIEKVHAGARERVDRIAVVQQGLLLAVPFWLCR